MNNRTNKTPNLQKRLRMREKERRKRLAKRFFILFVIVYITISLLSLLIFSLSLKSCSKSEKKHDVSVSDIKLDKKDLYFDNEFYIPISAINQLTELKLTGGKEEISFILECNSEYAKFKIDSTDAIVNGNAVELSNKALLIDGELYLPFDFFKKHMTGLTIELDEKENTYNISLSEGKTPEFILKASVTTPPINENETISTTDEPLDFVLDLSSYEQYMNPENRDEYLFLVNSDNPLTKEYAPTDLTGSIFTRSDRDTRTLRKYACLALEAFLKEGEANGIKGVTVTSAYRSYDYQNQLFQNEIAILGSEEAAAKNVNPPGSSEHQSGLAVDMHNMSAASREFGKTVEAKWLAENAHKFGFILRYPADKVDVTGISYEPWHFRFVGRYHATKMYELGLCLEEYIEYINK